MYAAHQIFIGLCSLLCVAIPVLVAGIVYLLVQAINELMEFLDGGEGRD